MHSLSLSLIELFTRTLSHTRTHSWTMEITNNSRSYSIPLVVGRRIAQIVFFDTDGTLENRSYAQGGKYQSTTDFAELKKGWTPLTCLPRMVIGV